MKKDKKIDTPLSRNLRHLLNTHKLTIREAAKLAGVSASTLEGWRNGIAATDYAAIKRLADHLHCSFCFLLTGAEETSTEVSIEQTFDDGGSLFDGYAKITIQRLLPKNRKKKTDD